MKSVSSGRIRHARSQLADCAIATMIAVRYRPRRTMWNRFATPLLVLFCCTALARAQQLRRATGWALKLGEPVAAQPPTSEFRGFACGSNGGAPRVQLSGFADFARCRAEPSGLHEVYFEY